MGTGEQGCGPVRMLALSGWEHVELARYTGYGEERQASTGRVQDVHVLWSSSQKRNPAAVMRTGTKDRVNSTVPTVCLSFGFSLLGVSLMLEYIHRAHNGPP